MRHIPALDGLRAIAVLAVVAYHAGLPVPAGFVGVDVFFVISGYVITRMLAREYQDTGRIDFAGFYARRVRRILPALVAVVAVTLAASAFLLSPDSRMAVVKSAVAAMAVSANLHFQAVTGGYWDASADQMPLLHLWSLAVEEQFYFIWPLLLALLYRFRRAPLVLAGLAAASFALAQTWPQEVAFYQMPSRFWELAVGGLIAFTPARSRAVYAYAGLALLAVAVMVTFDPFPGSGALPAVLGAALVIHAAHGGISIPALQLRPVRYVGLISYSLYLWHWPLLALHRAGSFDPPPLSENLALCGVAFILAALSYRFVETPFRRSQAPKVRAIGFGVATCLTLAACAGAMGSAMQEDDSLSTRTALDGPANAACHTLADDPVCAGADVMLWGDSHAASWRPYAERFGKVHQIAMKGCEPSAGNPNGDACAQFNARAVQWAKRGRVVVMGGYWLRRFNMPAEVGPTREHMASALAAVAPHVRRVVILGPIPRMRYHPQKCIQAELPGECAMPRAEFEHWAAGARAFLKAEAAKYPNVEYVEPADYFCNATTCPMMRDGYSLYWDDNHITQTAARNFTPRRK